MKAAKATLCSSRGRRPKPDAGDVFRWTAISRNNCMTGPNPYASSQRLTSKATNLAEEEMLINITS